MRTTTVFTALAVLSFLILTSCTWMRDGAIDQAAGIPVSGVISDIKSTSDEHKHEKHEERVEELNEDYKEFLRSRETARAEDEATEQSVVIKKENNTGD